MEKARKFHRPLYTCFVDLRKAYDTVNREALWSILQSSYRIPAKLISVIQAVHADSRAAVRAYGKVSEGFDVSCGVRQGCVLAPTLLIYTLMWLYVCHWTAIICRTKVLV